ncbi:MAG: triose-phosphate isomerase [Rhodospirillaceae bacterium]|jgi:triosephosphate isomerase|nr:triose-phosphate isomerase [Rhodospirillaceae bacterium]
MTSSRLRPLIAGNWKMNGSRALTTELLTGLSALRGKQPDLAVDLLVCPPAPYLTLAAQLLQGSGIALGAQDCHAKASGAHTGDVAAPMLADCGCSAVILGHSERRADHGESSEHVATKAKAALDAGLTAIVCVGETEAERDRGATLDIVSAQLEGSIPADAEAGRLVVAYEPVWAIGTGKTPTPDDVAVVHAHMRSLLKAWFKDGAEMRLLYGGSVKAANAATLMHVPEVNGALVGGASLKADDFWGIALGAAG